MKSKILLLFKKDFAERMSMFKQKGARKDIVGSVSSLILLAVVYGTFIYVFAQLAKIYVDLTFADVSTSHNRVLELTTVVYALVFVVNIIVGITKIHSSVAGDKDVDVLICQPISMWTIFFYKLIKIYFSQVVSSALVLVPAAIVIDWVSALAGGFGFYALVLLTVIVVPIISCAISALLSIPYTAIMRLVESKFVIHLIGYIVLIGVGFAVYGVFLETLTALMQDGNIQYIFDRNTVNIISIVTSYLYPSNLFANVLFGEKILSSILWTLGIVVVCGVVSYFVVRALYVNIIQQRLEGRATTFTRHQKCKQRSVMATLIIKEFKVVLRTPSYAFQYFATAVTLPFMAYVCANLMQSMMKTITIIDCNFAIIIFVMAMFSILTNTFCTTNISRDGNMFAMLKTMPIMAKQIVDAKVIFCMIVSAVSVLATAVVMLVTKMLVWWQAIFVVLIGLALSFAEIAFSTKRDLKSPTFPNSATQEITESNSNSSKTTLLGLIIAVVIGGGEVALSAILSIVMDNAFLAKLIPIAFITVVVATLFVVSLVHLKKDLDKTFLETSV